MNGADTSVGVIGLGYVGLPLAIEFGKRYPTVGFDVNPKRISELQSGYDSTRESSSEELASARLLDFSTEAAVLDRCNCYIIAVPTPVDKSKRPDLTPLKKASETIGKVISKGDVVIYESTVYPGATEEDCVPVIEEVSGLKFNKDFFAGYSPERINPGDKQRRLTNIIKITSGSTPETADFVDALYRSILEVPTHKASSIKVAEAAKVIENTQRDVNIALVNELAKIFSFMGIDTLEVLEAAGTKWNFLPFRPGLVGGHCIGVDPYYLTFKAESVGYHPEMILAERRVNDSMGGFIVDQTVKLMLKKRIHVAGAKVLILGLTFKENCPDIRNTRVTDIVDGFKSYGADVTVCDPWADPEKVRREYGINLSSDLRSLTSGRYDAIVLAVAHNEFKQLSAVELRSLRTANSVVYDIKSILPVTEIDGRL
ncbi:MAG: UDP-N-acetyl-D-glucosamine/UDP-N-acetyl-D-galactosamine dehydrogenase [Verrucomicrobiota bacterium]|jgi:UDP-N-acetyl-D-galactosamine dehydrogenase|nr:UDP-N-acetyl-D-glucosamine/UDP-N-acetyl-D-galactosamine dehydrogenase [Verrucomicrobiota bacterium]MDK2962736.1 UDP-N-acetyl-D-glucosamine/UDP-N-acetyl-D-galactosamine dehydrogenase [Verrucomicrobiota bacterium]